LTIILITGSTGFVGQNLIKSWCKRSDIRLYSLDRTPNHSLNIVKSYSWADLDKIEDENIDIILHLAGLADDMSPGKNEENYFEINYTLTKKIYDVYIENKFIKKFIYLSSVKAVADTLVEPLKESHIPSPKTAYGRSKLEAENYLLKKRKACYILRPCMIYGPGNKGNLNLLYSILSKGIPYPFGCFENSRSYLSIYNLIFVIENIISGKMIPPGTYNVSDTDSLATIDLAGIIGTAIGKKVQILKIPKSIIYFIARVGDFVPLLLNSNILQKITANYVVDNTKLLNQLGKELPEKTKSSLLETLKSFRN